MLALKRTGATLKVYSQIGLIMLVGLITKHGILIVEFANQLRERGKPKVEAVIEAASLRPILMTTAAMVLATVALAAGAGAGARIALAHWLGHHRRPAARHPADVVRHPGYTLLTRDRSAAFGTTQPVAPLPQE